MESTTLKNKPQGFTLVEMMVCLAIISVLSSILIVSQTSFNKNNILTDTAYTVAMSVREAQTFGLSSRAFSGVQNAGYGVHFGDSASYYDLFADIYPSTGATTNTSQCSHPAADAGTPAERPGNCYEESNGTETVRRYTFSQGYTISKICGSTDGTWGVGSTYCPAIGNGTLDIVYERPNTKAVITFNNATYPAGAPYTYAAAAIDLKSPQGGTRCIIATQLGEINVSTTCP